jgi:hypothetical protein
MISRSKIIKPPAEWRSMHTHYSAAASTGTLEPPRGFLDAPDACGDWTTDIVIWNVPGTFREPVQPRREVQNLL